MNTLWQDLRFGARLLLKQPGFTLIAILTLALGIGANAAIFSVVNAVMLRPLPYLDAERFVVLESFDNRKGTDQTAGLSPGDFWDLQQSNQSFATLVGMIGSGFSFTDQDNPESVPGMLTTPGLFQALNAQPLLGRVIADSDTCDGCPLVIVLSHRLWQRRFGGDPNIIGKSLPGNGVQVIGVMPPDFKYPAQAEVWQPLPARLQAQDRSSRYFQVYGLLKPGVRLEQAQAELQSTAARLAQAFPNENKNLGFLLTPFRERLSRDVRGSLLILLGAVGLVLLIACANVASLLVSRAVTRRHELAVRAALGATRGRLVRQWLSESLMLAGFSAALGWMLSLWAREALLRWLPENYAHLQLQDQLQTDARLLAFTVGVTLLAGLCFGLLSAWQATRPAIGSFLKDGQRNSSGRQMLQLRNGLIVAEVALAFVLLVAAGLLINSFLRLQRVNLGFDPRQLIGVSLNVPINKPQPERTELIRQLQETVANLPEVETAAVTTGTVFPYLNFQLNRANDPLPANEAVLYDAISPNYFTTLRGALVKGRYFTEQDHASAERVAVVNETLARRFFAEQDPLDQFVTLNYLGQPQTRRIVGVVRDLNQGEPGKVQPQLYAPYAQQPWFSAALVVRTKTSPSVARRSIQSALWAMDARQPISRAETAEELLADKLAEPRLYTALLSLFGALALVLSAIGLFGQISYNVAQRTQEFGIRLALGAQPRQLLRQVLGLGMSLTMVGLLVGLVASVMLTKTLSKLLYGVTATDPLTFAVIAFLLLSVALLACWIPARRTLRLDPMIALRYE